MPPCWLSQVARGWGVAVARHRVVHKDVIAVVGVRI